ncbi:hypothetical protein ACJIZ3_003488 [Penstemon smallii]|uniref:Myb/SANT-like domain-containing protein n=1 Tax=Penstemon smallii TaxID=265156 RepID=A0ABD3UCG9_9LAMI
MVATVYWSLLDEDKLVDFLVEAAVRGDFVVNASNKDVLTEISYRLSYFTGKDYTAFRVYNKVKGLKMRYFLWQWLSSESGVNWNRVTQALEAEDCVWERVLKEKPAAMVYRFQGERHWASLTLIFGGSLENVHPQGVMDGPNIDPNEDEIIVLSDDDDEDGEDIHVENGGVGAVNGVLGAAESVAFVEGVAGAVGNGVVGLP